MPRVIPTAVTEAIRAMFPNVGDPNFVVTRQQSDRLAAILALAEEVPAELLALEAADLIAFVASRAAIGDTLRTWNAGDPRPLATIRGFGANPVTLIYGALAKCPDQAIPPEIAELTFIEDDRFRESLRMDLATVDRASINREWKVATVLAGSILEALLLWALQRRVPAEIGSARKALASSGKGDPGPDLTSAAWTLSHYIEVAAHLRAIKGPIAEQARLAKDYRNLIHPAAAIRLGQDCHRGTAWGAVAAVEFVIRDLAGTQ